MALRATVVAFFKSRGYGFAKPESVSADDLFFGVDDVASGVARIAIGQPVNGIVEIAGPEQFRVDELVRRRLASLRDTREVVPDPNARYGGARVSERTLLPGNEARLGETRFETWLTEPAAQTARAA